MAVEAMEGTDATVERAGALLRTLEAEGEASTLDMPAAERGQGGQARAGHAFRCPGDRRQHHRSHALAGATCLSIEAGRTLIFDLDVAAGRALASRSLPYELDRDRRKAI